jgi:hypothetical protein
VALKVDSNVPEKHTVSIFSPEDEDRMFLRNVDIDLRNQTAPKPKTTPTSTKSQIQQLY